MKLGKLRAFRSRKCPLRPVASGHRCRRYTPAERRASKVKLFLNFRGRFATRRTQSNSIGLKLLCKVAALSRISSLTSGVLALVKEHKIGGGPNPGDTFGVRPPRLAAQEFLPRWPRFATWTSRHCPQKSKKVVHLPRDAATILERRLAIVLMNYPRYESPFPRVHLHSYPDGHGRMRPTAWA